MMKQKREIKPLYILKELFDINTIHQTLFIKTKAPDKKS